MIFKIWKITKRIVLGVLALFVLWFVGHQLMSLYEKNKYEAIGQHVEVDGKEMHVYEKGKGDNTIVLLTGLGTAAPALDFEPLVKELSVDNRVIVVEPFGYGWSEKTDKKRSVENITEEIRTAILQLDIQEPYILMPHSISGVYSMFYANKYPEEIKAIIGIDPTLPQALEYFEEDAPSMPKALSIIAPSGLARLAMYITPDSFLPIAGENTYSKENLKMTKLISSWSGYNRNVINETNLIQENMELTKKLTFPPDLPVMIFTSDTEKTNEDGKSNITFYEAQLKNSTLSKLVPLEGHHYLHWTQSETMSDEVRGFIKRMD
ncbi:MAG: alpha/beta hydrolase [Psychrobacillus sp.]|uniref:alpha/beta fold hydrolase n=1 Tax=Psychrobacillus sp. MER TA 171 TaxID=2939577 RepID=UPI00203F4AB8|nr:alpha/beta hydrolase [Psychrobacillus sp. MER TA 171]MCM3359458.1 alpha/beta hydrolase [Psychrobacillus sp. MER TA 171]